MTLSLHASTPAPRETHWLGGIDPTGVDPYNHIVSNSFSPPASSLIVAMVSADESYFNAWSPPVFSDSLGSHLTWNIFAVQADSTQSVAGVWVAWANCPSAQTAMTVSCALAPNGGQYVPESLIDVAVYTGADPTAPLANAVMGVGASNFIAPVLTPLNTGSHAWLVSSRYAPAGTPDTAGAGMFLRDSSTPVNTVYTSSYFGNSSAPTALTTGSAVTLRLDTTDATNAWQYAAFEVIPASTSGSGSGGPTATGWSLGDVAW